jgi:hypothetical protein
MLVVLGLHTTMILVFSKLFKPSPLHAAHQDSDRQRRAPDQLCGDVEELAMDKLA